MTYFVHESARCESGEIGEGTRIWAFVHILPQARIGRDCNICDHVFIENDVILGDRVTVKSGVQLWDGIRIDDDVFIGPNATFANDKFPRSKVPPAGLPLTRIGKGASIGANATILPGLQIGRNAMIGAGAVVTGNVPPHARITGNPGRIVGYVDSGTKLSSVAAGRINPEAEGRKQENCAVPGVTIHRLKVVEDLRGSLSVGEFLRDLPFSPKRYFIVYDVPSKEVRGEHAHHQCHQFLIAIRGTVSVVVDDGEHRAEIVLSEPGAGIHIPPMIWGIEYGYSQDACLLVFASEYYDSGDYIRDYEEFLSLVKRA
ncbi:MAG TPA: WxcM-like domain-containing protein [Stellaceae bacterium]|nr:WxcM-like domain-containing protein [Stellaceae bacterium]